MSYPYVAICWRKDTYLREQVILNRSSQNLRVRGSYLISDTTYDGDISPEGRQRLREMILDAIREDGFERFVVFEPKEAIRIDRDGNMTLTIESSLCRNSTRYLPSAS